MIKAVIFDFDGLIIDTETCEFESFRAMYEEYGVSFPEEIYLSRIGARDLIFDPFDDLMRRKGVPLDREQVRSGRRAHYERLLGREQARPGVEAYLRSAKELGLRIGLASSSTLEWIEPLLERLELRSFFECIRGFDHVKSAKPDPELYLQVIAHFGIEPHEAVAFEDSANGALAAVRAGVHCVVVPNTTTKRMTFPTGVRRVLHSMEEMPLEELIRCLGDQAS